MGRLILVTGAHGFIGKRLIARLSARHDVVATDRAEKHPFPESPRTCAYVQADLGDPSLGALLGGRPFDAVVHLAATISVQDDFPGRLKQHQSNVTATFMLLEAVRDTRARVIFASTGMVYGDQASPFREDMPPRPANFYAVTKLLGEDLVRFHASRHLILRVSPVYGPGQRVGMFIPSLMDALARGREFPMTGGRQVRDFLFIDDFVRAVELSLEKEVEGTYNLSGTEAVTMAEAAAIAGEITGRADCVRLGALEYRPEEIWDYRLDNSRIRDALSWRPEVGLRDGLERVVKHARQTV